MFGLVLIVVIVKSSSIFLLNEQLGNQRLSSPAYFLTREEQIVTVCRDRIRLVNIVDFISLERYPTDKRLNESFVHASMSASTEFRPVRLRRISPVDVFSLNCNVL